MEELTEITAINTLPHWYLTASSSLWHCTPASLAAGKSHGSSKAGMVLEGVHVAGGTSDSSSTRSVQAAQAGGTCVCHIRHRICKWKYEVKNNGWQHKWEHKHVLVMWPGKALPRTKDKFQMESYHITFIQRSGRKLVKPGHALHHGSTAVWNEQN